MPRYTFNELVERKQKQLYRSGLALSDDILARIYTIQDILEGFYSEEEAREAADSLEKSGNILYTTAGLQFSYEEIRRAIQMRDAIKRELARLNNILYIWKRE